MFDYSCFSDFWPFLLLNFFLYKNIILNWWYKIWCLQLLKHYYYAKKLIVIGYKELCGMWSALICVWFDFNIYLYVVSMDEGLLFGIS